MRSEKDRSKVELNRLNRREALLALGGAAALFLASCESPTTAKPVETKTTTPASDDTGEELDHSPVEPEPEHEELSEFEEQEQQFQEVGGSFGDKLIDSINEQLSYDRDYAEFAPMGAVTTFEYDYFPGTDTAGNEPRGTMTLVSPILHTEVGETYDVKIKYDRLDPSMFGEVDGEISTADLSSLKGYDVTEIIITEHTLDGDRLTTEVDIDRTYDVIRVVDNAPMEGGLMPDPMSLEEALTLTQALEDRLEYVYN